jgi:carbon-monoxide dehydrogenase large subunit
MAQGYIGAPIRRREDIRFLTGKGSYVDDVKLPHMLHAAILRSPRAHARILAIDTAKARAIPGVEWVFTLKDIGELAVPVPMRMYALRSLLRCIIMANHDLMFQARAAMTM